MHRPDLHGLYHHQRWDDRGHAPTYEIGGVFDPVQKCIPAPRSRWATSRPGVLGQASLWTLVAGVVAVIAWKWFV